MSKIDVPALQCMVCGGRLGEWFRCIPGTAPDAVWHPNRQGNIFELPVPVVEEPMRIWCKACDPDPRFRCEPVAVSA